MSFASDNNSTLDAEVVEGSGGVDALVIRGYTPPSGGEADTYKEFDQWLAKEVFRILQDHYFGWGWHVMTDGSQGVFAFSIPDLMGPTLNYVVRLAKWDGAEATRQIIKGGGVLLERMGLPRGPIDIAARATAKRRMETFEFNDSMKKALT